MTINRAGMTALGLALADGMKDVGIAIIQETQPPDAPPLGEGLVRHGGTIVYAGKKKVAEWSIDGTAVKKPRALKISQDVITAGVGFDRPARFDELGTVHQAAKPFFWPAVQRTVPRIKGILQASVRSVH